MKSLMLLGLSLLFLTSVTAKAAEPVMYSCQDIYAISMGNKIEKRDHYNDVWNKQRGDASYNGALTLVGFFVVGGITGSLPITLAVTLTPALISTIKNLPSKEERVAFLQNEAKNQHKRFLKRLHKSISPEISSEEVVEIIQNGFDSGAFCADLPSLSGPADIRKHVRLVLKEKYGKIEK